MYKSLLMLIIFLLITGSLEDNSHMSFRVTSSGIFYNTSYVIDMSSLLRNHYHHKVI